MLTTGDLVKIQDSAFKYFANKLAIVDHIAHREEYFDNDGKLQERLYYLVTLAGTDVSHVLPDYDLILVSKAKNRND